jgi:hypothetical protein
MTRIGWWPRAVLVGVAAAAALAPGASPAVDERYSRGVYLAFQQIMTRASNLVGIALFDVLALVVMAAVLAAVVRRVRTSRRRGWVAVALGLAGDGLVAASVVYLVFLAAWGLNYRRVPLADLLDFDRARVTPEALRELARRAVDELNRLYDAAQATDWPSIDGTSDDLAPAFASVQRDLGLPRAAVPGRPKRSLLGWYFPRAAIDGMTDPFFLEVILNPEMLPFERPMALAHEWAHLAGFADEAEASFVGWVTCLRAGDRGRYSAWLSLLLHLAAEVPRRDYAAELARLEPGPRENLRAIIARVDRSAVRPVREVATRAYDRYLKANRVEGGVQRYDEVVTLVAGTRFDEGFVPRRRPPAGAED